MGNRLEKTMLFENSEYEHIAYQFNELDQLFSNTKELFSNIDQLTLLESETTTQSFDLNGSMISRSSTNGDSATYTFNLQNKLSGSSITRDENGQSVQIDSTYKYNDDGIRVQSNSTTTIDNGTPESKTTFFLIDSFNPTGYAQVLEEHEDVITNPPTVSYVIGKDIISQSKNGNIDYLLTDGHGSTRVIVDGTLAIVARYDYDGFGNKLGQKLGVTNEPRSTVGYVGEIIDVGLGFVNSRARYYDPATGLFTQRDTYAGNFKDPMSLHKYAYTHNNPINGIDPTGLFSMPSLLSSIAISTNLISFGFNVMEATDDGNTSNERKRATAMATLDLLFLFVPFAGGFKAGGKGLQLLAAGADNSSQLMVTASAVNSWIAASAAHGTASSLAHMLSSFSMVFAVSQNGGNTNVGGGIQNTSRNNVEPKFDPKEQAIADYLEKHTGRKAIPNPWEGMKGLGRQADAIMNRLFVEFKTVKPNYNTETIKNMIDKSFKRGGQKSGHFVVDTRDVGMSFQEANESISRVIGRYSHKVNRVEIIGNDFHIDHIIRDTRILKP